MRQLLPDVYRDSNEFTQARSLLDTPGVVPNLAPFAGGSLGFFLSSWVEFTPKAQEAAHLVLVSTEEEVDEILEEVRAGLDQAGFEHLPSQQIVLTGGGSQIPGLDGLASKILGQQVRLGRPLRVHGLPQAATGPGFASAVGLSLFAAHPQDEWWDFDIPADRYPARSLKRAVKWFRDNW